MGSIRGASNLHHLDFHYDANLALSFGHCQNRNGTLYGRGNHSDHTHWVIRDMGHCDSYTLPSNCRTRKRCISLRLIHYIANYRYVDQLQKAVCKSLTEKRNQIWPNASFRWAGAHCRLAHRKLTENQSFHARPPFSVQWPVAAAHLSFFVCL